MRILFLTARPPWPARRGDQLRASGLAEELSHRHQVEVVSQAWGGISQGPALLRPPPREIRHESVAISARRLLARLAAVGPRPVQVALHDHRAFREAVRRRLAAFRPEVAVVVLSRLGHVLDDLPGVPVVVDFIDALGANMERRGLRQPWLRPFWTLEARRMESWDRGLACRCRRATVVAERDRAALVGADRALAEKVDVVPLGLRLEPVNAWAAPHRPVIALTGNLGYFPTADGAVWFAREVWPEIRRREPRAEWWLAGARPTRAVRRLADLPGVRLEADPEDLASVTRRAAVAVAPLWSGSGTPIKILEAMAAMVPVVTTSAGRAGLDDLPDGAVIATDGAGDLAAAVAGLLADPERAHRQARLARRWLERRHDLRGVAQAFEAVLDAAVSRRSGPRSP